MTRLAAIALALPFVVGCAQVLGIVEGEGQGAGGSGGGMGGSGGGMNEGAAMPAPDWSDALSGAVYSFEDITNVGACTNDAALDLTPFGLPTTAPDSMSKDGSRVLEIKSLTDYLETSHAAFAGEQPGLTFGGWFNPRVSMTGNVDIMGKAEGTVDGYAMTRGNGGARAHCRVYADTVASEVETSVDTFEPNVWSHIVCRADFAAATMAVHVGGLLAADAPISAFEAGDAPFRIGDVELNGTTSFIGFADEVFYSNIVLSDASIRRIWACRIDGTLCECDAAQPSAYLGNCGRLLDDCDALPPCDGEPTSP